MHRTLSLAFVSLLFASSVAHAWPTLFGPQNPGDGGVSGGGGNFVQPIVPFQDLSVDPRKIVSDAYDFIYNLSENYEEQHKRVKDESSDVLNKFATHPRLHHVLENIHPLIYTKGSCLNKFYKDVDGSVYSFEPNTICVSAFNLKEKVDSSDMFAQAVGILSHEYAELIGLTDEEAIALQKKIVLELRKEK